MARVSVIVPTFNRLMSLQRCIHSVQRQTERDWELIVLDDQSTDGTADWVVGESRTDPRLVYHRNLTRMGSARNISQSLEFASADFFIVLCDDDYWDKEFLQHALQASTWRPNIQLVCGRRIAVRDNGKEIRKYVMAYNGVVKPMEAVPRALRSGNLFGLNSSVLVGREAAEKAGGFHEENWTSLDFELYLQIASEYNVAFAANALSYQVMHGGTETEHVIKSGELVHHELYMLNRYLSQFGDRLSPAEIQRAYLRLYSLAWIFLFVSLPDRKSANLIQQYAFEIRSYLPLSSPWFPVGLNALRLGWDRFRRQYT
ncbi:MAG: glycosyltransferase family 2 protein [Firmicutes bacterium]|nr:glycosyltransferase family 2 protein [Bacillota bacterium]